MSGLVTGIISLGITATTTGISMAQKSKAKKAQSRAEMDANEAMNKARKRLDVNYQEAKTISKDPYTMAIEASLQQGADAVQASRETVRGAANVGRIQTAQNQMVEGQRVAYGQELQAREQAIIDEDSRLRDINTQLDMGEIEGAQMAAAEAADEQARAGQDIVAGVGSMVQQGMSMAPLYSKDLGAQKQAIAGMEFDAAAKQKFGGKLTPGWSGTDFSAVGDMSNRQFRQFKRGIGDNQFKQFQLDPQYMEQYKLFSSQ